MEEVYVGIGSNIEPKTYINKVKKELQNYFECTFSDNYKYDPVGFNGPEFINLVVKFTTNLPFKEVEETQEVHSLSQEGVNCEGSLIIRNPNDTKIKKW